jgi:hypothetical protein
MSSDAAPKTFSGYLGIRTRARDQLRERLNYFESAARPFPVVCGDFGNIGRARSALHEIGTPRINTVGFKPARHVHLLHRTTVSCFNLNASNLRNVMLKDSASKQAWPCVAARLRTVVIRFDYSTSRFHRTVSSASLSVAFAQRRSSWNEVQGERANRQATERAGLRQHGRAREASWSTNYGASL